MLAPKGLSGRWAVLIAGDFAVASLAAHAALALAPRQGPGLPPLHESNSVALWLGLFWLAALYFEDLYVIDRPQPRFQLVASLLSAALKLGVLIALVGLAVPSMSFGARFYATYMILATAAVIVWRLALNRIFSTRASVRVMVAGRGECARLIANEVKNRRHLGYRFLGFVEYGNHARPPSESRTALGEPVYVVSSLAQVAPQASVSSLVMADHDGEPFPVRELMQWRVRGTEVVDCDSFYERMTGKLLVPFLRETWVLFAPGFVRSGWRQMVKRLVDVAATIVITLGTLPIALLTAIAIRLDSAGPILYAQDRLGLDGEVFRLYKFRSMYDGAENGTGPVWAAAEDPRVSRVGRVIRRLRIDELPQLLSILRGDMSLVGPRPERPELVAELAQALPLYHYRHSVRPGLTGWAQICFPYGANLDDAREKLCYDLYYIKNWSLVFDLQIMMQTVKVVLLGRGAR